MDRKIYKERKGALGGVSQTVKRIWEKREGSADNKTNKERLTALKPIASCTAVLLFTCISAGTPTVSGIYPFGIAVLCAAGDLPKALCALAGNLFALFFIEENALVYGVAALSVFFVRMFIGALGLGESKGTYLPLIRKDGQAFSEDYIRKKQRLFDMDGAFSSDIRVRMLCSLAAALTVGVGRLIQNGEIWYDIFAAVFIAVCTPVLTFGYYAVSCGKLQAKVRKAGVCAIGFTLFLSISDFTVGGMNVGVVLAFLAAQITAVSVGLTDGMLLGLFSGMAMEPALAPLYAVGAAATGILYSFSPGAAALCSAALGISWALYADGIAAFSNAMPEIILAAGIFYPLAYFRLIPKHIELFGKKEEHTSSFEESFYKSLADDPLSKTERISTALLNMSRVFRDLSKNLRVPSALDCDMICERAFEGSCTDCKKRSLCHAREGFKDGRLLRLISKSLSLKGSVSIDTFPEAVKRGCPFVDTIGEAINKEYRLFKESVIKTDKTTVIADDYEAISELIKGSLCSCDKESLINESLTERVKELFEKRGIISQQISVYGRERIRVFIRGLTVKDLSLGSEDIHRLVQESTGTSLTEPCLSIEYDRLDVSMESRKKFSFKKGHYSDRSDDFEANGDAVCTFSLPDGKECVLICDGMGSGSEAALTARISVLFLERMLTAGCPVETALKLLNNFTRERRIECFSTIDLFIADSYSGKAQFIKSGAAPSFVLRENKLFRMECNTQPVGILKGVSAKSVAFELKRGDTVIMISDGILPDEENSAWLYDILCSSKKLSAAPYEAAREILFTARENSGLRPDDATVAVIKTVGENPYVR